ncbi:MAG TPA: zf-HC2 domain-containing protein [Ktedonobacterales bacterium]|nr:zf-HC2 domain-containing protein [Ktedonobacterales bacterium]
MSDRHDVCAVSEAQFSDWYDGILSPRTLQSLNQHVASCPKCRRRLDKYDQIQQLIRAHHTRVSQERVWRGVRERVLRQPSTRTGFRIQWQPAATALALVVLVVALAQVFRSHETPSISPPPTVSDAQAWGNYRLTSYDLSSIGGGHFTPIALTSDGLLLGGYSIPPDGRNTTFDILTLATTKIQHIASYSLTRSDETLSMRLGINYALISNEDGTFLKSYNLTTGALANLSQEHAAVLDAALDGSVAPEGIVLELVGAPDSHNALQILHLANGSHLTIASDVKAMARLFGDYLVYQPSDGRTAMIYHLITPQHTVVPSQVSQALFAPGADFQMADTTAFFTLPLASSHIVEFGEVDDLDSTSAGKHIITTTLATGTRVVAANTRLVLLSHQGHYLAWDRSQRRFVTLPAGYRMASLSGNWLWLSDGNQLTVINTDGLPLK